MLDYCNEFQTRHLLSKFEDIFQEHFKLLIDPEEIDNAMNVSKNQEFRVIEIAKIVENFYGECRKFGTLYKTF